MEALQYPFKNHWKSCYLQQKRKSVLANFGDGSNLLVVPKQMQYCDQPKTLNLWYVASTTYIKGGGGSGEDDCEDQYGLASSDCHRWKWPKGAGEIVSEYICSLTVQQAGQVMRLVFFSRRVWPNSFCWQPTPPHSCLSDQNISLSAFLNVSGESSSLATTWNVASS